MVTRQGESHPFIRNVFTLSACSHIVGSQVLSFDSEAEMLEAWRDFVNEVDPDVVIGYNIANFDLPYLIERAAALKTKKFTLLGRMISKCFRSGGFDLLLTESFRQARSDERDTFFVQGIWSA